MGYNRLWIAVRRAELENAKQYAQFYNWYVGAFGPTAASSEANDVWQKFRESNPMVGGDTQTGPQVLPGYNADWRQWVAGQRAPAASRSVSDLSDADIEAELRALRGQ